MSTIDTARLRALAESATHKRWKATTQGGIEADDYTGPGEVFDSVASVHDSADWEYIDAADPQTMLALLDEIERLRGEGEGEWEYGIHSEIPGNVISVGASWMDREFAEKVTANDSGNYGVRRRKAGEWEPVEGDGNA